MQVLTLQNAAGNEKIGERNAGPLRLRVARRMTFRLALLALAASMASGHSATFQVSFQISFLMASFF